MLSQAGIFRKSNGKRPGTGGVSNESCNCWDRPMGRGDASLRFGGAPCTKHSSFPLYDALSRWFSARVRHWFYCEAQSLNGRDARSPCGLQLSEMRPGIWIVPLYCYCPTFRRQNRLVTEVLSRTDIAVVPLCVMLAWWGYPEDGFGAKLPALGLTATEYHVARSSEIWIS